MGDYAWGQYGAKLAESLKRARAFAGAARMKWPFHFRRPEPIASGAALAEFIDREAAYLAQKSATDYCWAKAGLNAEKLFGEAAFQAALAVCRWESFAAVLSDAIVLVEGRLRQAAPESEVLGEACLRLHADILQRHSPPSHLPEGWAPELEAFATRLARARLGAPAPAAAVAATAAKRVFRSLPLHDEVRQHDFDIVSNAVKFGFVAFAAKLDERLDVIATARDLQAEE